MERGALDDGAGVGFGLRQSSAALARRGKRQRTGAVQIRCSAVLLVLVLDDRFFEDEDENEDENDGLPRDTGKLSWSGSMER